MIAITTSNSTSVNPDCFTFRFRLTFSILRVQNFYVDDLACGNSDMQTIHCEASKWVGHVSCAPRLQSACQSTRHSKEAEKSGNVLRMPKEGIKCDGRRMVWASDETASHAI